MANTASDQKVEQGASSKEGPTEVKSDATPKSSSAQTVSTWSISDLKRVKEKPALIRTHVKDPSKELDFWNGIFKGLGSEQLDAIVQISTSDPTYDMNSFIRGIEYQGFDREFYIRHGLTKMSVSIFCRFAIIGALRGSNFAKIVDSCESMPKDIIDAYDSLGIVKTPKKRTDLTILRNTACIPHWCAYWFIKAGVDKKIPKDSCHAALQFPGAASLPMSREVRIAHLQFCSDFSKLLPGGHFNMNIYMTAYNNPIPLSAIPVEVTTILGIKSSSESYKIADTDVEKFAEEAPKAVVKSSRR